MGGSDSKPEQRTGHNCDGKNLHYYLESRSCSRPNCQNTVCKKCVGLVDAKKNSFFCTLCRLTIETEKENDDWGYKEGMGKAEGKFRNSLKV